eukprot:4124276-Amphidinium_carterae.1
MHNQPAQVLADHPPGCLTNDAGSVVRRLKVGFPIGCEGTCGNLMHNLFTQQARKHSTVTSDIEAKTL